jgi:ERCC4-type nuclease
MFKDTKNEKQMLYSAIFSLNYYKGFSVIRTYSLDETAFFICNCVAKLIKGETTHRKAFYLNKILSDVIRDKEVISLNELDNNENQEKEYISVVKKVKKENITQDNIDEIMLCQIPGISNITALALIKHFGNLASMIECIKTNEECLKEISYTNDKNQTRKLTKTSISNLNKFLLKK